MPDQRLAQLYQYQEVLSKFRSPTMAAGVLEQFEEFWRDHYSWLKDCGYLLRPRYSPGWSAPWLTDGTGKFPIEFEESVTPNSAAVLDATRISDGSYVMLKRCDPLKTSDFAGVIPEVEMFRTLSSEPLASDPRNRCIRQIEILRPPQANSEEVLIVMPLLYLWKEFPFSTIGEAVDFLTQIFEGLQFMHNNNIWHGDCKYNSIMMDAIPILRDFPHPWEADKVRDFSREPRSPRSRTQHPVRYYWIDFDLSGVYDPSAGPPLVDTGYGGNRQVPEWAFPDQQCNPFAVDIWCLGHMIREQFTEGFGLVGEDKIEGFEFLHKLVADMCNEDPAQRPTIDDVVNRFSDIRTGLGQWKLRSRFTPTYKRPSVMEAIRSVRHWARQFYFMARQLPAIPSP
ncbi:kinase-like domain-containing protein [Mycena rosella]|uniref:Kinase-like domain-containing protein n=1 Tax=Mycena rosella TaxID=1033263 RepID=A0AAD7CSM3_MYCRO|nr:kinase-like domain-containing protein [Mycena rosella]